MQQIIFFFNIQQNHAHSKRGHTGISYRVRLIWIHAHNYEEASTPFMIVMLKDIQTISIELNWVKYNFFFFTFLLHKIKLNEKIFTECKILVIF